MKLKQGSYGTQENGAIGEKDNLILYLLKKRLTQLLSGTDFSEENEAAHENKTQDKAAYVNKT